MFPSRPLAALGAAAGLLVLAPAAPAQSQDPVAGAQDAVRTHPGAVKFGAGQDLSARGVITDANGTTHVHLDRTFKHLPVLGGDLVVHRGPRGEWKGASLTLDRTLDVATTPAIDATAAAQRATAPGDVAQGSPALVVDARKGEPRLAWQLTTTGTQADGSPSEQQVTVDATTGAVLVRDEEVETGRKVAESAFMGTGQGLYSGPLSFATTYSSGAYHLKDLGRGSSSTVDAQNATNGRTAVFNDADNVWGGGGRQDAAVDAQYGTDMTWDFYRDTFGRLGIRGDGSGSYNRVHWGVNYNNAFWSNSCWCMTYGDGDGVNYTPFVALDVAGHEMSHGVTAATANLTYSGESGGLNEANSDVMGTLVEFYASPDRADYLIGEDITPSHTPLRWMATPSKDQRSADCWSPTVGSLNVHYSSGVGNHFFYLLAEGSSASPTCDGSTLTGITRATAAQIWYRALTTYMTSSTDYHGARTATLNAARDLDATGVQSAAVDAAWRAVGVS